MRERSFLLLVCVGMLGSLGSALDTAPKVVYGTYLGGRHKECAMGVAADDGGDAYVVGRTPSGDFPVTAGAFSKTTLVNNDDWTGFVSKISKSGEQLLYSSFLGGDFFSSANAIAVDSTGRAFVVGSTCSSKLPTTQSAISRKAPGSDKREVCDGFVAWLDPSGSQLEYGSYLGGSRSDSATTVALGPGGNIVYIGGYTSSPDFPIAGLAAQSRLNGSINGFLSAIEMRSGRLLYSTYLGGTGNDRVTGIAVAPDGEVYVAGATDSQQWPNLALASFGKLGGTDGFLIKIDPTGKRQPLGIRFGGAGEESLASIDLDSHGDIYAVGTTDSSDFPVKGTNLEKVGSGFALRISGRRFADEQAGVVWSRRVGGHGEDALLSVSAGLPESIFVSGRSGSSDFPTTHDAIYGHLEAANDSTLLQMRASDGQIRYATFLGGTRQQNFAWYNDEATGVLADSSGNVYVTGCTADDRLPVTPNAFQARRAGNADAFVLRMKFATSQDAARAGNDKRHEKE